MNIPVNDSYKKSIALIHERVHTLGGKLVTSGIGKAGQIAVNIATTFCATGTPAIFLHPTEAQHGDLGLLQTNDILLLVSNSGKTREIIELTALAKNLDDSLPLIVLTGDPETPLGHAADVVLSTGAPEEVCPLGLSPTTSTTAMSVIGDLLVTLMMKKIAFTADEFAKRHHGGYLGQKLNTKNSVVMMPISFENRTTQPLHPGFTPPRRVQTKS